LDIQHINIQVFSELSKEMGTESIGGYWFVVEFFFILQVGSGSSWRGQISTLVRTNLMAKPGGTLPG